MRATEICGEVFCEIWAVFLTVWLVVRNATLIIRNATLRQSKCRISRMFKCGICLSQVRRLPCRSVAFRTVKCGISLRRRRRSF